MTARTAAWNSRDLRFGATLVIAGANLRPAITSLTPLMPELRAMYGLNRVTSVLVVALPVFTMGAASALGPGLARRFGAERTIAAGLIAITLGISARCAWLRLIFPGTVLAAVGITVVAVLLPMVVRRRGYAIGRGTATYLVAMSAGAAAAPALSGLLVHSGVSVRASTGVWAASAAAAAVVWWRAERHDEPGPDARITRGALPRADAWSMASLFALQAVLFFGIVTWLPEYSRDRGLGVVSAGLALAVFSAVGITGSLVVPLLAGRLRSRALLIAIITALSTAGFALLASGDDPLWAAVLLGTGQAGIFPLAFALFALRAADSSTAAALSALSQGFGFAAAAVGLVVLALLRTQLDWQAFWLLLSVLAAVQFPIGRRAAAPHSISMATPPFVELTPSHS